MSRSKTYDIAGGDKFTIMGEQVTGVDKLIVHDIEIMDDQTIVEKSKGKSWRFAADCILYALAQENKYIVSDIVIIYLESADLGLNNYSALGGVFRRAAAKGYISRIDRPTKQALWISNLYKGNNPETE